VRAACVRVCVVRACGVCCVRACVLRVCPMGALCSLVTGGGAMRLL